MQANIVRLYIPPGIIPLPDFMSDIIRESCRDKPAWNPKVALSQALLWIFFFLNYVFSLRFLILLHLIYLKYYSLVAVNCNNVQQIKAPRSFTLLHTSSHLSTMTLASFSKGGSSKLFILFSWNWRFLLIWFILSMSSEWLLNSCFATSTCGNARICGDGQMRCVWGQTFKTNKETCQLLHVGHGLYVF